MKEMTIRQEKVMNATNEIYDILNSRAGDISLYEAAMIYKHCILAHKHLEAINKILTKPANS